MNENYVPHGVEERDVRIGALIYVLVPRVEELEKKGFSPSQIHIILEPDRYRIAERLYSGRALAGELRAETGLGGKLLDYHLSRLKKSGLLEPPEYVIRTHSPLKGRSQKVCSLSPKGKELFHELQEANEKVERLISALSV